MANKNCDGCEDSTPIKNLGKIRGKNLCKKCRIQIRKNHREETINSGNLKEEITQLTSKINKERGYSRKAYRKKVGRPVRKYLDNEGIPVPKGSISGKVKQKNKSESYLGFQESQVMLKIIMGRGLDFEDAKEELERIKEELKTTREKMKEENKSEEEIKTKHQKMLEELYNQ